MTIFPKEQNRHLVQTEVSQRHSWYIIDAHAHAQNVRGLLNHEKFKFCGTYYSTPMTYVIFIIIINKFRLFSYFQFKKKTYVFLKRKFRGVHWHITINDERIPTSIKRNSKIW